MARPLAVLTLRLVSVLAVALAATLATGCNPYDPDLGDRPFRCAPPAESPRCPESYEPVESGGTCMCQRDGSSSGSSGADAATGSDATTEFACADDSAMTGDPGGNDTTIKAVPTTVGDTSDSASIPDMSICPVADVDLFAVKVKANQTLTAQAQFVGNRGHLTVHVLDGSDTVVATGSSANPNESVARYVAQTAGTFYVRVKTKDSENNYALRLSVAAP